MGELKPFAYVFLGKEPNTKLTHKFSDDDKALEIVVYPEYIDWDQSSQRAWLGILRENNVFAAYSSYNYHSFTELILQVRQIFPGVGIIRTIIPEPNKEKVVIY